MFLYRDDLSALSALAALACTHWWCGMVAGARAAARHAARHPPTSSQQAAKTEAGHGRLPFPSPTTPTPAYISSLLSTREPLHSFFNQRTSTRHQLRFRCRMFPDAAASSPPATRCAALRCWRDAWGCMLARMAVDACVLRITCTRWSCMPLLQAAGRRSCWTAGSG